MADKSPKPPRPWPKAGEPPALKGILEIALCPYCSKGDPTLACTNMVTEDEFQVWCRLCWAHGPSRPTEREAVKSWNEVSVAARGEEMKTDVTYVVVLDHPDGHCKKGDLVVFRWRTDDGKDNVFNPEGQSDMDSAFKINVAVTKNFVSEIKRSG